MLVEALTDWRAMMEQLSAHSVAVACASVATDYCEQ